MPNTLELEMLKANLGFYDAAIPGPLSAELTRKVGSAEAALAEKGISIDRTKTDDCELVAMYAAWLYRSKAGVQVMPQSLSYAIRNRQVHLATEVSG